MDYVDNIVR